MEEHLSKEQYAKILKFAAMVGCKYLTFNVPNSECKDCGWIGKRPVDNCPECTSDRIITYDRVIGFIVAYEKMSEGRRKEFLTRVRHHSKELTKED